jgi:glutamine amidotransferase
MFMHNGKVGGWDVMKRRLESAIPDEFYCHRHGTTDSEAIFLMLLAEGLNHSPKKAVARTLGRIEAEMRAAGVDEPLRFTSAFTNGVRLFAVRYATSGAPETLYTRRRRDNTGRLLVSEPLDDGRDDWQAIPPQSFVEVSDETVAWHPFEVEQ